MFLCTLIQCTFVIARCYCCCCCCCCCCYCCCYGNNNYVANFVKAVDLVVVDNVAPGPLVTVSVDNYAADVYVDVNGVDKNASAVLLLMLLLRILLLTLLLLLLMQLAKRWDKEALWLLWLQTITECALFSNKAQIKHFLRTFRQTFSLFCLESVSNVLRNLMDTLIQLNSLAITCLPVLISSGFIKDYHDLSCFIKIHQDYQDLSMMLRLQSCLISWKHKSMQTITNEKICFKWKVNGLKGAIHFALQWTELVSEPLGSSLFPL